MSTEWGSSALRAEGVTLPPMEEMPVPNGALGSPRSLREARYEKYSRVQLRGIYVRKAASPSDFEVVESLRAAGFARVAGERAGTWVDQEDYAPGVFSLLSYDDSGQPLATMRVQDGRHANLELARFVPLEGLIPANELPAAQFARLSVVRAPQATEAMFGLFKAAWLWCYQEKIRSIVIATPPWAKPIYDFMFFEHVGSRGEFEHAFAGGARHVTMKLPVLGLQSLWRPRKSPLCTVFFEMQHPNLII